MVEREKQRKISHLLYIYLSSVLQHFLKRFVSERKISP
jgi:hypothetical protein